MGASESTGRPNGSTQNEEEEEERPRFRDSGGSSTGAAAAIAMAAAGAAVAAWGVSRMLSDNTNTEENKETMTMQQSPVPTGTGLYPRAIYPPPFRGHFKMNTDGACRPNDGGGGYVGTTDPTEKVIRGPSGYGGILRDHHGRWVRGFHGFIGVSDCLTAEFHGILQGLILLDKLGYKDSLLESDSVAAVEWVNHDETKYRRRTPIIDSCWSMIIECKRLMKKNGITVYSVSRDANKCADKLADLGIDRRERYMEIVHLPHEIKDIVDREAYNILV